jgi:hypothetical protein
MRRLRTHPESQSKHLSRLMARTGRTKSGPANFACRRSRRTVRKKYRFERKGRRRLDTALEHPPVTVIANQATRTRQPTGGPRFIGTCVTLRAGAAGWRIYEQGGEKQG